jgi:membrane-associated phospholipid phosphatase
MKELKKLFQIEKTPKKGLMALEWVVLGYIILTLLIVFFTYTKIANPEAMIWGRMRIAAITVALWAVYRMVPCRVTRFLRVCVQMTLLAWWYPDTYEINRMFPNLDHVFATWEQSLFGFQPALVFASNFPSHILSELMDMGYAAYFPMILLVEVYFFFCRYREFERASLIILSSFFIYYVIFIFLPVAGPQYYYGAIGLDNVAHGIFPNVHDYFDLHQQRMVSPGWSDGLFYHIVEGAHEAGERPTAAFPSSHVGIAVVLMLLVAHARNWKFLALLTPFFVFLCFSTVYIQAHYAIDAIAGLLTGAACYFGLLYLTRGMTTGKTKGRKSR